MPTKFTQTLSDPREPDMTRPDVVVDTSIQDAAEAVTKAANIYGEYKDEKDLEQAEVDTESLLGKVAAYEQEKRDITLQMSMTGDKEVLARLERELMRLRRGEVQGKLPPGWATVQMNRIIQRTAMDNPSIADDVRAIGTRTKEGISAIVGYMEKEDPETKVANEILETAARTGDSPFVVRQNLQAEARAQMMDAARKQAEGAGLDTQFLVRADVQSKIDLQLVKIYTALNRASREGGLVARQELLELSTVRDRLKGELMTDLVSREAASREAGQRADFGPEFRKEMIDYIDNRFSGIDEIVKNLDGEKIQTEHLRFIAEKMKNEDIDIVNQAFGKWGAIMRLPGGFALFDRMVSFAAKNRAGLGQSIEALAKNGDPDAAAFLVLRQQGFIDGYIVKTTEAAVNGRPVTQSMNNKYADQYVSDALWAQATNPGLPAEKRAQIIKSFLLSSDGLFRSNIKKAFDNPETRRMIVQYPELRQAAQQRMETSIVSHVNKLDETERSRIIYNSAKKRFEVDPNYVAMLTDPRMDGSDSAVEVVLEDINKTIMSLNNGMRVMGVIGSNQDEWANSQLQYLQGTRDPKSLIPKDQVPGMKSDREGSITRTDSPASEQAFDGIRAKYFVKDGKIKWKPKPGLTPTQAANAMSAELKKTFGDDTSDFTNALEEAIAE